MPRNGAVYSLASPPYPYEPGTPANAEDLNTSLEDIAVALTNSVPTDGSAAMTGNMNANGHDIGGVGTLAATTVDATALNSSGPIVGNSVLANTITSNGIVQSSDGRVVSTNIGNNPSVTVCDDGQTAAGCMYYGAGTTLDWGPADGNGNPTGSLMGLNMATGNLSVAGTVSGSGAAFGGTVTAGGDLDTFGTNNFAGATNISGPVGINNNLGVTGSLTAYGNIGFFGDLISESGAQGRIYMQGHDIWMDNGNVQQANVVYANAFEQNSARALKQDIEALASGLQAVLRLRPVSFRWRDAPERPHLGFIAEEVADTAPDAAQRTADGGRSGEGRGAMASYSPTAILALAVRAIQELSARVDALEARHGHRAPTHRVA